jgi:hypothetical protein
LAKLARTAAGSAVGIGGTSETTLKSAENVRSRAVTCATLRPRPAVSVPATTAKFGITMLSFLAPVASTFTKMSDCERTGGGEASTPARTSTTTEASSQTSGRPGRIIGAPGRS